jgi:hypothetical protein
MTIARIMCMLSEQEWKPCSFLIARMVRQACAKVLAFRGGSFAQSQRSWTQTSMHFARHGATYMAISADQIKEARAAARARMKAGPRAVAARYDRRRSRVTVSLDSGVELAFPPDWAEGLAGASPAELSHVEISPTGLGLHWPRRDADLYLPALINGIFGSPRWMAGGMGKLGGRSRSAAKKAAARANGRHGGRPRKAAQG